eukprot:Em0004g919a
MATKGIILAVGVGLTLLSLCYCLPNAADVMQKMHKRQIVDTTFPDGGLCLFGKLATGAINASCTSATEDSKCTSACNSLYSAIVSCYGATFARTLYAANCPNGYQGAAGQATFSYTLLVAVLVAAVMRIVG